MKKVGIREAQKHLTTLLKEMPFAITRYGETIAIVQLPGTESSLQKSIEEPEKPKEYVQTCKHGYPAHLCTKCK